jgi:hypothetical protein
MFLFFEAVACGVFQDHVKGPHETPPAAGKVIDVQVSTQEKLKSVAYWVTTVLGPASFVIGGVLFLSHGEQQVATLTQLGYPPYLLYILGLWKLLAARARFSRRSASWPW